jgi:hypothetical protein
MGITGNPGNAGKARIVGIPSKSGKPGIAGSYSW